MGGWVDERGMFFLSKSLEVKVYNLKHFNKNLIKFR
jgi:hypothetical protein